MASMMDAKAAEQAILNGQAPDRLIVSGRLAFYNQPDLKRLPEDLWVDDLDLYNCPQMQALPHRLRCGSLGIINCPITSLPEDLQVDKLEVSGCQELQTLPPGLRCGSLRLGGWHTTTLPADLQVTRELELDSCAALEALPAGLSVQTLTVANCPQLKTLPPDLQISLKLAVDDCPQLATLPPGLAAIWLTVNYCPAIRALPEGLRTLSLSISNCPGISDWPQTGPGIMRRLTIHNCAGLRTLPPWLFQIDELTISDCANLREVPAYLHVRLWMEVAQASLRSAPQSSRGIRLRWRGVPISGQAAFHPETLSAAAVLKENNAEIRRVLLERMGYERFVAEAQATTLDEDADPGGARRLLQVPLADDEPLVCLAVLDPSTGRQYLIRVPPAMQTCHQAAAWIAGFDNPDDYDPIAET
jgi:hypothetical protein